MSITLKNEHDIAKMRVACKLASEVLDYITPFVKAGVTTGELDRLCHEYMTNVQQTIPAPLNYQPPGYPPFPKAICTSVNDVICHGIPGDKTLKTGDTVNLDITVIKEGYFGDTSRMFIVGEGSILAKRLVQTTYECMWLGIDQVRPGAHLGDIGHAIQRHAEAQGYSVVREYCGHGIGTVFHEDPQVVHYGRPGTGLELKAGCSDLHDRADDQCRTPRHPHDARSVDGQDPRSQSVRSMGAHRARDADRLRRPDGFSGNARAPGDTRRDGLSRATP